MPIIIPNAAPSDHNLIGVLIFTILQSTFWHYGMKWAVATRLCSYIHYNVPTS